MDILKTPIRNVKNVGPKRELAFQSEDIYTLGHLLNYIPIKYLDRREPTQLKDLKKGEYVVVKGKVTGVRLLNKGGRRRLEVILNGGKYRLKLIWFNFKMYQVSKFEDGQMVLVSGEVSFYKGFQIIHPEVEFLSDGRIDEDKLGIGRYVPCYSIPESLKEKRISQKVLRQMVNDTLKKVASIPDPVPAHILQEMKLPLLLEAYRYLHFPESMELAGKGKKRLVFNELFYFQLMMAKRRMDTFQSKVGIQFDPSWKLVNNFLKLLPFELTNAQKRVLQEIRTDMVSGGQMNRLLEGDVGSGKTIVALIAMMIAVDSGYQAAIMAPTEILAEQHYHKISGFLEKMAEVNVRLLTGGMKQNEKDDILKCIGSGSADIVIGTHTLIQEGVEFKKLGFVVVDEQHKFGVVQRSSLQGKGKTPDVLIMTATPIPRSLALSYFGDLDLSVLDEMPPGRTKTVTFSRDDSKRPQLYDFIRKQVQEGRQVYFVYPLVEESEKLDLKAATQAFHDLKEDILPYFDVDLIHGRMKENAKDDIMQRFRERKIQVLVSTTVIEVGIDVPNATVMVIEHAERFGLSQLHQLRGRIGRGAHKSYCILMVTPPLSENARKRISIMCKTSDGFKIAEEDLKIRGPGQFFGVRQHGLPDFAIADFVEDSAMMEKARRFAFDIIKKDPELRKDEHELLKRQFIEEYNRKFQFYNIG